MVELFIRSSASHTQHLVSSLVAQLVAIDQRWRIGEIRPSGSNQSRAQASRLEALVLTGEEHVVFAACFVFLQDRTVWLLGSTDAGSTFPEVSTTVEMHGIFCEPDCTPPCGSVWPVLLADSPPSPARHAQVGRIIGSSPLWKGAEAQSSFLCAREGKGANWCFVGHRLLIGRLRGSPSPDFVCDDEDTVWVVPAS